MAEQIISGNPWKGLNFYVEGEVLYGRSSEIESLSQYIISNTQTVLYGKSGIGKSSILNAGIFPIARRNGLLPIGIRLDHSLATSYFRQIREAILKSGVEVREVVPVIDEQRETLWEYLHRNIFYDHDGQRRELLLVFDQFEEIFTLQQNEKTKVAFFEELANLLNDVTPLYIVNAGKSQEEEPAVEAVADSLADLDFDMGPDDDEAASHGPSYLQHVDYHIVFTLREDFLSYLERYTAYIPVMKSNRYALLPLNEEQAAEIIMQPRKGLIDIDVAEQIIQKVTGRHDFTLDGVPEIEVDAAVLSLYLSRLYTKKGEHDQKITAELVSQFSNDIIKDFYEESVAGLPTDVVEKVEDELITYDGRRNNVSRNDLIRYGVPEAVIDTLVDDKKLLRQFSYQGDIRVEFMHDILCPVVDARINQRELARQQEEERRRQEEERQELLRQQKEELERIAEQARRQKRKNRRRMITAASVVLFMFALWLGSSVAYDWTWTEDYGSFTTRNGWPVGLGKELDGKDKRAFTVYYRLTRQGWLSPEWSSWLPKNWRGKPFTKVEVMTPDGKPTANKLMETPVVRLHEVGLGDELASQFARKQLETASWSFYADEKGSMIREVARSLEGKELYAIQFYYAEENTMQQAAAPREGAAKNLWANYVDKDGYAMRVRDNGIDRMRIILDKNGFVKRQNFFTEARVPQMNQSGCFGYSYVYDEKGLMKRKTANDEFGDSLAMTSVDYLAYDEYGRWTVSSAGKASYDRHMIVSQSAIGSDTLRFADDGRICYSHICLKKDSSQIVDYNENGRVKCILAMGKTGVTFSESFKYAQNGQLSERLEFRPGDSWPYLLEKHSNNGKGMEDVAYYVGKDRMRVDTPYLYEGDFHIERTTHAEQDSMNVVTKEYLDTLDQLFDNGGYAKERIFYDQHNNPRRLIRLDQNEMPWRAYLFYYNEDNLLEAQSVMGVDMTPVRCPALDDNRLSYYKMKYIKVLDREFVSVRATNEFDEPSLIVLSTDDGDYEYHRKPLAASQIMRQEKGKTSTLGMPISEEALTPLTDATQVPYIHIKSRRGTAYAAQLKDGDLLLAMGAWRYDGRNYQQALIDREWGRTAKETMKVTIARPNKEQKCYDVKQLEIVPGDIMAEVYPVYFTPREMERVNKVIKEETER